MALELTDEMLSAYLDDELSPGEQALVEARLAADPQARQLVEELRALSGEVRELPRHAVSIDFSQRVVQAAQAAKSSQNGEVTPASLARAPALPNRALPSSKVRRDRRLPVVLAGAAAVAAAVAIMVWIGTRPPAGPGGGGTIAKSSGTPVTPPIDPGTSQQGGGEPAVAPGPVDASAVEEALARLRLAIPQEGEGLVLRLRIGAGQSPSEALDAAFAAAGLGTRGADDESTGALSVASAYQNKLAEKVAGQPADATFAAADAVFITAPLDQLEKAISALALSERAPLAIAPLMSGRVVIEAPAEGEQASKGPPKPRHFAQRLSADQFRLEKSAAPLAEIKPAAADRDPAKPVRVLILVEP